MPKYPGVIGSPLSCEPVLFDTENQRDEYLAQLSPEELSEVELISEEMSARKFKELPEVW